MYSTDQKKPNRECICEGEWNGYRTGTRTRTQWEQNGYRTGTEQMQNGYQTEMERIRNGYELQKMEKVFSRTQTIRERILQNTC